jgi:hypothetical protein
MKYNNFLKLLIPVVFCYDSKVLTAVDGVSKAVLVSVTVPNFQKKSSV